MLHYTTISFEPVRVLAAHPLGFNFLPCHSKCVNVIDEPKPPSSVTQLSIFKHPSYLMGFTSIFKYYCYNISQQTTPFLVMDSNTHIVSATHFSTLPMQRFYLYIIWLIPTPSLGFRVFQD